MKNIKLRNLLAASLFFQAVAVYGEAEIITDNTVADIKAQEVEILNDKGEPLTTCKDKNNNKIDTQSLKSSMPRGELIGKKITKYNEDEAIINIETDVWADCVWVNAGDVIASKPLIKCKDAITITKDDVTSPVSSGLGGACNVQKK
ncbi:hypothetical protein BJL95_00485 [Methylomonas sp. LWB]|uniref:hypothetical protein n=1 Tax=Methylomonas sp. LWB TaxID=1905845 RepID=UPI0008DA8CD4|nr:hypothetical protein [Methylomonas sp. LWB]OHX35065.1 hypothetical protein BJL95_00485 [Methylomonas sp. LWB]